jgi:hypothetical protein
LLSVCASILEFYPHWERDLKQLEYHFQKDIIPQVFNWEEKFDLIVEYENWENKKFEYVNNIAKNLKMECNSKKIIEEIDSYKTKEKHKPETMLYDNHISKFSNSHYKERLSEKELDFLKNLLVKNNLTY